MADNRPPPRIYLNKQSMGAVTWGLVRGPGDLEYVHVPEGSTVFVVKEKHRETVAMLIKELESEDL